MSSIVKYEALVKSSRFSNIYGLWDGEHVLIPPRSMYEEFGKITRVSFTNDIEKKIQKGLLILVKKTMIRHKDPAVTRAFSSNVIEDTPVLITKVEENPIDSGLVVLITKKLREGRLDLKQRNNNNTENVNIKKSSVKKRKKSQEDL